MMSASRYRCAIYTRKSSEEGLEQDFNSLDAQREACEAFIASQASLGWRAARDRYDDGGIAGGTLERPALQRLLDDIRAGRVDVVVVYKIDRLTRSLTDFAKIVEVFDERSVSFVSVTQSFNTTSSMGRLTLNVLLSFAQFEREVTSERIRDKIAASKRKGMWMGGMLPLGYDVRDRKLVINPTEAETIRKLFALYLESGSIQQLRRHVEALDIKTKQRVGMKSGRPSGGGAFSSGHLRALLSNAIYVGGIRHRKETFDGQHEPIISREVFDRVQALLASRANTSVTSASKDGGHLLNDLLYDEAGDRLGPTHATKAGKRYRYYVSRRVLESASSASADSWRLPANQLDSIVCAELDRFLRSQSHLVAATRESAIEASDLASLFSRATLLADDIKSSSPSKQKRAIEQLVRRVDVTREGVRIHIDPGTLVPSTSGDVANSGAAKDYRIDVPISLKRRGVEAKLIVAGPTSAIPYPGLVSLIARAHIYLASLTDGSNITIEQLAEKEQVDVSDLSRILRLAFLAPTITEAILKGQQPTELTPRRLMRIGELPFNWDEQRVPVGF